MRTWADHVRDGRCTRCGSVVQSYEGEPVHEMWDRGYREVISVGYTLQPCGDQFILAVNRTDQP